MSLASVRLFFLLEEGANSSLESALKTSLSPYVPYLLGVAFTKKIPSQSQGLNQGASTTPLFHGTREVSGYLAVKFQ